MPSNPVFISENLKSHKSYSFTFEEETAYVITIFQEKHSYT